MVSQMIKSAQKQQSILSEAEMQKAQTPAPVCSIIAYSEEEG